MNHSAGVKLLQIFRILTPMSDAPGDSGVFLKEGPGLHQGHTDVPPLEGRQQEVWPDLPEPS